MVHQISLFVDSSDKAMAHQTKTNLGIKIDFCFTKFDFGVNNARAPNFLDCMR